MRALSDFAPFDRCLEDGLEVRLRPIVPEDRERIHRAYELLSEESRLNRFWERPPRLSERHAARLAGIDRDDRLAWIALNPADESFPGYAGASFWRDEEEPARAELSFTVADAWQRRGLATLLYSILWHEGWRSGVREFTGQCRKQNRAMARWWTEMGGRVSDASRHFELSLVLEDPAVFLERIAFAVSPSYRLIEVAAWLREWKGMGGGER
jgi:GNAT superfamily N-acetyltransferase